MIQEKGKSKSLLLFGISFLSISMFIYQVILTRVISAIFTYHYTFIITSFSILGLGIGGIIAYRQLKNNKTNNQFLKDNLIKKIVLMPISYIFVLGLFYILPFSINILVYIIPAMVPFIIGGYILSSIYSEFSDISNKLYFADLIGSGLGSILVLFSLNYLGVIKSIILISIISSIAVIFFVNFLSKKYIIAYAVLGMFAVSIFVPQNYISAMEKNFGSIITSKLKTFGSIISSGDKAEIVYTKWNAFSRTDVIRVDNDPNEMIVTIDGTASSPMYKFDGKDGSLDIYKKDVEYLPYIFGKKDNVLIIGPGGGRDILYALAGKSKNIIGVEINTSTIDAVRHFKDFNGDIYNKANVKIYGEDGRYFINRSKNKYDIIYLSMVMTSSALQTGYALNENYIYTVEALKAYIDHLSQNGKLVFLAHDEEDMSKIVATAIGALSRNGVSVEEATKYIAVINKDSTMTHNHGGNSQIDSPLVIIKNKPFTIDESNRLEMEAMAGNNKPLYIPNSFEVGPLFHLEKGHLTFNNFLRGFPFIIKPATDDKPYFYNFNNNALMLLIILLLVVLLGIYLLFRPMLKQKNTAKALIYFGALGTAYMLIEISLIQKFILYLGHPITSFTYVLAALLVGSGIGSILGNNSTFNKDKKIYMPPFIVAVISIVFVEILDVIFKYTFSYNLINKIIISSILVMIPGFFMGMPFPRGIRLLGTGDKNVIPIAWGINGAMSVIGSILSVIISMIFGFKITLITGAIIYGLICLYNRDRLIL